MCGIAAMLLYPQERPADVWRTIKELLTQNLLANEERGREATGVVVIQQDGSATMVKSPLPASQFVQTVAYQSLLQQIDQHTTLILGHARKPTKGSPNNNGNNHPLQVGAIWGVHNGTIRNDNLLFEKYGYARQAEVDSEIIFQLLAPIATNLPNGAYLEAIRPHLRLLKGEFTFLVGHQQTPSKLLVVKHDNPLTLHYQPSWQLLVFSSRYIFLRKRFGRVILRQTLPPDELLLFEADQLPQTHHQPMATLPLYVKQLT